MSSSTRCLGPNKSADACTSYKASATNAACAACVLTPYSADRLGPILDYGEFVGGNVAGCIELSVPGDPSSCANAVQALTDCEVAACQANCPVSDTTSLAAREQCSTDADATGCRLFFEAASACRAAETDAGVASACMNGAFQDFYDAVVPLFCGQATADAAAIFDASSGDAGATLMDGAPADAEPPAANVADH